MKKDRINKKIKIEKTTPKQSRSSSKQTKLNVSVTPKKESSASPAEVKVEKTTPMKMEVAEKTEVTPEKKKKIDTKPINPFFLKKDVKTESNTTKNDSVEYNPGKSHYDPIKDAFWKHGEK